MTTPATFRPADSPKVVGISRATLYRWEKAGHIKLYRQGGMTFAKTAEVVDFITGDCTEAGPT
ncbi:helix-turn-helix domain-containing protein [Pseudooceanicola marinus]|uniref:helix-turn-helix domain-containing protein n=1 Tax=Pseudooceanicola marinus TaxID=396013 RepID=UPI001CD6F6F2|nr:helix-turn-helix domain-containing protein [Pseudooceanicola marinus]MCA1338099.1 helix-turn-helix domain-containing protein [Pseudooceanicola marinus]